MKKPLSAVVDDVSAALSMFLIELGHCVLISEVHPFPKLRQDSSNFLAWVKTHMCFFLSMCLHHPEASHVEAGSDC